MPEIPEIIAHSERLDSHLNGSTLKEFQLLNFAALKTFEPQPQSVIDKKITKVKYRGKYLCLVFENQVNFVIHLMQAGRLVNEIPPKKSKPKNYLIRMIFTKEQQEQSWVLTEAGKERKAGLWVVSDTKSQPLDQLGPDVTGLNMKVLNEQLQGQSGRIHKLLRNQRFVAGIGRLLANEVCHRAKISPFVNVKRIDDEQKNKLLKAVKEAIEVQLKHERTLETIGKSQDRPSLVHNRDGKPCLSCSEDFIRSIEYSSYTVFYCASCQTQGKILADNKTSKFLK